MTEAQGAREINKKFREVIQTKSDKAVSWKTEEVKQKLLFLIKEEI